MQRTAILAAALCFGAIARAQQPSQYPPDIHSDSRNRLPIVARDHLDDLGKPLFDKIDADFRAGRSLAGFQGPNGIELYSPSLAQADFRKADYLRFESPVGRRLYEVAILTTAREWNQQFEWAAHEPAARAAGVDQAIIDVIRNRGPLDGLQPEDAAIIQMGREAVGQHAVQPATFARALEVLRARDLVDIVATMGQYTSYAVLLDVFDQRLAPGQASGLAR